jgi:oligoendopeptidase F
VSNTVIVTSTVVATNIKLFYTFFWFSCWYNLRVMKSKKYKTSWDLKSYYSFNNNIKTNKNVKNTIDTVTVFVVKWRKREDWLNDKIALKELLDEYDNIISKHGGLGGDTYFNSLKFALDRTNNSLRSYLDKISDIEISLDNELEFINNKLSKIPDDKKNEFVNAPELVDYKHFLEHLFALSKYLLSETEEKILNLISKSAYGNWVEMTSGFLVKEEKDGKGFSDWMGMVDDIDKEKRDKAFEYINSVFEKFSDVATEEMNSILYTKKVEDELRGFKRPDEFRILSDDLDPEVIDSLIKAVTSNFDFSKDYYKLKAHLLKTKKLKYHERNVPVGVIKENFDFDYSCDLFKKVLKKLDPEFESIFVDYLEKAQIDVYPKIGKTDGGFCTHGSKKDPVFILLNHTNKLRDVTTLAHEFGHALNNEYIKKSQNEINFGTPLCTAEVSSTFFEDFILEEISKDLTDEQKIVLNMERLNDFVSSVQRQIACYKFEQELHQKYRESGYIPKEEIGKLFTKNMSNYMGNFVEQSPGSENWWVYWSHIRTFFYVYSYASGLLISKYLQSMVRKDPSSINKVKTFLSTGTSRSPKEIFLDLGIDISDKDFWSRGIEEAQELLEETKSLI